MKSLFRSIRMKLLGEGKLVRYLTYAFWEILLIVIGIMLALQLNNWYGDRKEQAEFDEYIAKLKVDVRTAIENVEKSKATVERFRKEEKYIRTFLNLSEYGPEELALFENGLRRLVSTNEPQVSVGLLGELLDGESETIRRNPALVRKARELESNLEANMNNIERNSDRLALNASNLNQFFGPGSSAENLPSKYDLENLKSSEEFLYTTYAIIQNMRRTIVFDERIIADLNAFLTVLDIVFKIRDTL